MRNGIEAFAAAQPFDGMAARQPPRRQRQAFQGTVFVQGFERIDRTGRLEAAGRRHQRRQRQAIKMDWRGEQGHRDPPRAMSQTLFHA